MARRIITLLTDFGAADAYVGVMKGVIFSISPDVSLVDLSHDVQPQAVGQAAFLLGASYRFFPSYAIHVAVVDPGVGSSRRALVLITPHGLFVAPDNGVLSYVLRDASGQGSIEMNGGLAPLPPGLRAYVLDNPRYWLQPVSQTFHGRDVFAPVAAHLSLGVPPEAMGPETREAVCLPLASPRWVDDVLEGEVVHVDRFGNLITSIPADALPAGGLAVEVKGKRIEGLSRAYAEKEGLLAIVGSHGCLEISVKNGSAARTLRARIGDRVRVVKG